MDLVRPVKTKFYQFQNAVVFDQSDHRFLRFTDWIGSSRKTVVQIFYKRTMMPMVSLQDISFLTHCVTIRIMVYRMNRIVHLGSDLLNKQQICNNVCVLIMDMNDFQAEDALVNIHEDVQVLAALFTTSLFQSRFCSICQKYFGILFSVKQLISGHWLQYALLCHSGWRLLLQCNNGFGWDVVIMWTLWQRRGKFVRSSRQVLKLLSWHKQQAL